MNSNLKLSIFLFFYKLSILLIRAYVSIGKLKSKKLKDFSNGRKDIWRTIKNFNAEKNNVYWFHAASLGEFEQAKPIIESIKSKEPNAKIVITFFSPSGFNYTRNYKNSDLVCYLPYDTRKNIKRFIQIIKPTKVFIVRYEFWYFLLKGIKEKQVPLFLISAVFSHDSIFNKWYGALHRDMLTNFQHIFLQDFESGIELKKFYTGKFSVVGDTRLDSVIMNKKNCVEYKNIEKWLGGEACLIAGSIYEKENEILAEYYDNDKFEGKIILVPHNIAKENVTKLSSKWNNKNIAYYSDYLENELPTNANVLMIDSIGILKNLYQYAKIVCIGGGFGKGIHNTLEPAVWCKPLLFGTNYKKFPEAVWFVENGCAKTFNTIEDFAVGLSTIETNYDEIKIKLDNYFATYKGATEKIMNTI